MRKKRGVRDRMWRKIAREEAWKKQEHKCIYCRTPLKRSELTSEHRHAVSEGGTDHKNIDAACAMCNSIRGNIPVKKFMRMMTGGIDAPWHVQVQAAVRRLNLETERACKRIRDFAR